MEKEKKVLKCIDNKGLETRLTIGRYYPADYTYSYGNGGPITYYILDDLGAYSYYSSMYFVEGEPRSISTTDPIVEQVKELFDERSQTGMRKYGTTLQENNIDNFFKHLQEELMDAVLYLQKLKDNRIEEEEEKSLQTLNDMMKRPIVSEKENTSIDYIIEQYEDKDLSNEFDRYLAKEKAKEMFKQQIIDAFFYGRFMSHEYGNGEGYFNKTFKQ
jgi:hypothetical protein